MYFTAIQPEFSNSGSGPTYEDTRDANYNGCPNNAAVVMLSADWKR